MNRSLQLLPLLSVLLLTACATTPADVVGAGTQLETRQIQTREYDTLDRGMTVTVAQKEGQRISVRANARVGENSVTDAATYQDFFVVLDKAMFLTLHKVD